MNGKVITVIPFGESVEIQEKQDSSVTIEWLEGTWAKVDFEGQTGYVLDAFLTHLPLPMNDYELSQGDYDISFPLLSWVEHNFKMVSKTDTMKTGEIDRVFDGIEEQARQADPTGQGINIRTSVPEMNLGGNGTVGNGDRLEDTQITLQLSNVPLAEAIRYTAALASLKYKVEENGVAVIPLSTPDSELLTRAYIVPPNFLAEATSAPAAGGAGSADPFAAAPADNGNAFDGGSPAAVTARQTAKNMLESLGITFQAGTSAVYNPETGQLIVRFPVTISS